MKSQKNIPKNLILSLKILEKELKYFLKNRISRNITTKASRPRLYWKKKKYLKFKLVDLFVFLR